MVFRKSSAPKLAVVIVVDQMRADYVEKFGTTWTGGLRVGFPWDRRKERNAYKKQLIALEQAKRTLEEQEDAVKLSVRSGLRNVVAAQQSYKTQVEAMKVARLRVESNNLFLESGRSTMRDILEAESAMLSAPGRRSRRSYAYSTRGRSVSTRI